MAGMPTFLQRSSLQQQQPPASGMHGDHLPGLAAEHSSLTTQGRGASKLRLLGTTRQTSSLQSGIFVPDAYSESSAAPPRNPQRTSTPAWDASLHHSHRPAAAAAAGAGRPLGSASRSARPGRAQTASQRPDLQPAGSPALASSHSSPSVRAAARADSDADSEAGSDAVVDAVMDERRLAPVCERLTSDMQASLPALLPKHKSMPLHDCSIGD